MIPTVEIQNGDCLELLRAMPGNSVHMVVTSPPYYGLRSYGIPPTKWADGTECCLGWEPTVAEFIAHLVEIFDEVHRVLRPDGTCWVNMGDSYAGKPGGGQGGGGAMFTRSVTKARDEAGKAMFNAEGEQARARESQGKGWLKPKQMMGVPWRMAFALQDAGWYLRSEIIWSKPNPMPESTKDRPCKSHEHIFLLSKRAAYYYDAEAVKVPVSGTANSRGKGTGKKHSGVGFGHGTDTDKRSRGRIKNHAQWSEAHTLMFSTRNLRTVWPITTQSCKDAHFATFPKKLAETCILAGTSAGGCCHACGKPFSRVIENGKPDLAHQRASGGNAAGEYHGEATKDYLLAGAQDASATKARILAGMVEKKTVGWIPTCKCENPQPVPPIVLDIFGGSGTTGMVAIENGRSAILMELSGEYVEIAKRRTNVTPSLNLRESKP